MLRNVAVFTSRLSLRQHGTFIIPCTGDKVVLLLFRQRSANPIAGSADIDSRFTPGRRTIGCRNVALELLDLMLLNQADGAAAETGPGQPRAVATWYALCRRDQRI